MQIRIKKHSPNAQTPTYGDLHDAGFDFYAPRGLTIGPGEIRILDLEFSLEVPPGYYVQIVPRSGLACRHGITIINSPGTADSAYRASYKLALVNHSSEPYAISPGDRVAQGILQKVIHAEFEEALELSETGRGEGFGSSGR